MGPNNNPLLDALHQGLKNGGNSNFPPSVRITEPAGGTTLKEGATINIKATATDSDGGVAQVMFKFGGKTVIDKQAPYEAVWQNSPVGKHTIQATATDTKGLEGTSSVMIEVVGKTACTIPAWDANKVYNTGDEVSYNLHRWEAKWWTQGNQPGTNDVWLDKGLCTALSDIQNSAPAPLTFQLDKNYPNPFNPTTIIGYTLPHQIFVTLKVFDILGREVVTLVNGQQAAGKHQAVFDASKMKSGVYIYK